MQLNMKTRCIHKQLFKFANSIFPSNGNQNCALNFNTTNKKNNNNNNQEFAAPKEIMRFGAKFFVSPTGSRYLGEMKLNDDN